MGIQTESCCSASLNRASLRGTRPGRLAVFVLCLRSPIALGASSDPWHSANAVFFTWNDYFDQLVVRPTAFAYTTFLPRVARRGVSNFFSNVDDVNVLANNLLQLKVSSAANDCGRLLINTTVGVAGLIDVASAVGLRKNDEDFGQTLAKLGVGSGPYVMLPVFGASSARDSVGLVLDTLFNPIQAVDDRALRTSLFVLNETDSRSRILTLDELIVGYRYLFVREAYLQRRAYQVADGKIDNPVADF